MTETTINRLLEINAQFYQQFGAAFDATRRRLQPGVQRLMEAIPPSTHLLDLGCGNGLLAHELLQRGFKGTYTGVDSSQALLEQARSAVASRVVVTTPALELTVTESQPRIQFHLHDIASAHWPASLAGPFDIVLAFAVLHHLPPPLLPRILATLRRLVAAQPGETSPDRSAFTRKVIPVKAGIPPEGRKHLVFPAKAGIQAIDPLPTGCLVMSNWQFLNSPRWSARVQPWERAGLSADQVGPGDALLDWHAGGEGLRYVHHFRVEELTDLAVRTDWEIVAGFSSDGREGDLALYQIWRPLAGKD